MLKCLVVPFATEKYNSLEKFVFRINNNEPRKDKSIPACLESISFTAIIQLAQSIELNPIGNDLGYM